MDIQQYLLGNTTRWYHQPILANIYLDKFDKYIKEYAENFNKGKGRRLTCEYQRNRNQRNALRWKLEDETDENRKAELKSKIARLRKQMLDIPATRDMDDTFKRLKYVRYADDFLIGMIGSKEECKIVKADITTFMREKLKLEMSQEKTLITNAQEPAKFLGYEIMHVVLWIIHAHGVGYNAVRGWEQLC